MICRSDRTYDLLLGGDLIATGRLSFLFQMIDTHPGRWVIRWTR